jgi:ubiquitin carboxyl-terminal hydrolase 4/11/15
MVADATSTSPDATRKRPRSHTVSAQEDTYATTPKRGALEELVIRSSPEGPQASSSTNADIDAYMAAQGERDPTPLDLEESSAMPGWPSPASGAPGPYGQLMSIRALKSKTLAEGDIWFLVSKKWYSRWEDACTGRVSKEYPPNDAVGPIDNTDVTQLAPYPGKAYDLVSDPPVVEGETAEFIPKLAHEFLEQWYVLLEAARSLSHLP